jgi:hypothetical protein
MLTLIKSCVWYFRRRAKSVNFEDMVYRQTPVERRGNLWFKREDLFEFAGMRGL